MANKLVMLKNHNMVFLILIMCVFFFFYFLPLLEKMNKEEEIERFIGINRKFTDNYHFDCRSECCNPLTSPPFFRSINLVPNSYSCSTGCVCTIQEDNLNPSAVKLLQVLIMISMRH